jgi:hypothetical protein
MMNQGTYKHPEFPYVNEALVEALDQAYPLTSPSLSDSERQIFLKAGQRQGDRVPEATSR